MTSTAAHDSAMTTIAQLAGNANKLRAMIGGCHVPFDEEARFLLGDEAMERAHG